MLCASASLEFRFCVIKTFLVCYMAVVVIERAVSLQVAAQPLKPDEGEFRVSHWNWDTVTHWAELRKNYMCIFTLSVTGRGLLWEQNFCENVKAVIFHYLVWTRNAGEAWPRDFQLSHTMQSQEIVAASLARWFARLWTCSYLQLFIATNFCTHAPIALNSRWSWCDKSSVQTRSWQDDVIVGGQQRISLDIPFFKRNRFSDFTWIRRHRHHNRNIESK